MFEMNLWLSTFAFAFGIYLLYRVTSALSGHTTKTIHSPFAWASPRLVYLLIGFGAIVLTNLYEGLLLSTLLIDDSATNLRTLNDFIRALKSGKMVLGTKTFSRALFHWITALKTNNTDLIELKMLFKTRFYDIVKLFPNDEAIRDAIIETRKVSTFDMSKISAEYKAKKWCHTKLLTDNVFGLTWEAMPFRRNYDSGIIARVNKLIDRNQEKIIEINDMYSKPFSVNTTCADLAIGMYRDAASLPIDPYYGFLIILGATCLLAFGVLMIEHMVNYWQHRRLASSTRSNQHIESKQSTANNPAENADTSSSVNI